MSGEQETVVIKVGWAASVGDLPHLWASIGFDELNWSYTPRGQKLFATLKNEIIEQPYYVRNHNTFTSGNGLSYPAGGSTNLYREDAQGQPIYNWEIVDQIYDTYIANNCRPLIELGFLPLDLVPDTQKGFTGFGSAFDLGREPYESGKWKLPPKDFSRWEKLVEAFVSHLLERYGAEEVANWYFELWNEPDIPNYWLGTVEDYCQLYDHSVAGAVRAFAQVKIGGPATTDHGSEFLRHFLQHCAEGKNHVSGEIGTKLDFISFHTKGAGYTPRRSYGHEVPHEYPSLHKVITDIRRSLEVISEFPRFHKLPVFVDECDPAVGTIYGVYDNPNFIVCNTEYYPAFVAAMVGQILNLNETLPAKVSMITHWAFYFEGKRFFEGNRTLVTNENIWNPIMAGLKMLGKLGQKRVSLSSSGAADVLAEDYSPTTRLIDGLATVAPDNQTLSVLVWQHCDDWAEGCPQKISLQLQSLPFTAGQALEVRQWRVDGENSNAYSEWVAMGRPEGPTPEQLEILRQKQQLSLLQQDTVQAATNLEISLDLPAHALSLFEIGLKDNRQ